MRLAEFRWSPYALPFRKPFSTATATLAARSGFLLWLKDEDGRIGIGDAAPLPFFGGESPEETGKALAAWRKSLPGREFDPAHPIPGSSAGPAMEPAAAPIPPAFGLAEDFPNAPTALHGLEQALLDLSARRAGLSLAKRLHPAAPEEVAVNATLGLDTPRNTARAAREAVAKGFGTLKVKVGGGEVSWDTERLAALREAVGADVNLRIDANGAWEEAQALRCLEDWSRFGIEYVEQPLAPEHIEAAARLARNSPVPLAADEAVVSPKAALRLLEREAVRVLILKPMMLGGILAALDIARQAHARGVKAVVTTALESAIGRSGALHAAAAVDAMHGAAGLPGAPPAHGLATGALLATDVVPAPPQPLKGRMTIPDTAAWNLPMPGPEGDPFRPG